jgi:hypothetical protein
MPNRLLSLTLLLVVLISVPAMADVYNNGPISGTIDGWVLNFGFVTSDTFTVAPGGASLTGLSFGAWLFPGDTLNSVEVSITSAEFGGTVYLDQTLGFSASNCAMNLFGFNVCTETANFNASLNGGTYWLNMQNATVDNGDPVYWDENYGPSMASENQIGTIYSEAFTIQGTNNGTGTTPEVTSILLFGTGVLGMAGVLRRKHWR